MGGEAKKRGVQKKNELKELTRTSWEFGRKRGAAKNGPGCWGDS